MTDPLTKAQRAAIVAATNQHIDHARQRYRLDLPELDIRFDVFGASWGYYVRKGHQRWLRFNPLLFALHFDEGLRDTVPHEVAHYVVDCRFPRRRCKPHGAEWREVMAAFGIDNPRATHNTSLDGLRVRRQRRHIYHCGCGEVALSTTRHNRIQRDGTRYFCRRCHQPLLPEPPEQ